MTTLTFNSTAKTVRITQEGVLTEIGRAHV